MNLSPRANQQGALLITVVIVLAILAAMALTLSSSSSLDNALVANHAENTTLDYLSESGVTHAKWLLAHNTSCTGYQNVPTTAFGANSYSATVTPTSGSPVTITAVGALANGATRNLTRNGVKVYDPAAQTLILQPGSEGKDNSIEGKSGKTGDNNGDKDELRTSSLIGDEYRTLLQFDLSAVPPTVSVQTATLELQLKSFGSTDVVEAHRVLRDWTEMGATWNDYDGVNTWNSPGGDYDPDIADSFLADGIGWKTMDITAVAEAWVHGLQPNYGLILLSAPSASGDENRYESSDKVGGVNHPKLTLTFSPEC